MSGIFSWFAAIAVLAGMAFIIGLFNQWPAHETLGSLAVCILTLIAAWVLWKVMERADT